ncbi:MAG TPA: hypothetical protein VF808_03915 [Ktedonobacterales bacterium]
MMQRRSDLRAGLCLFGPWSHSEGQSFVEYVLIILFVALAIVAALTLLGPQIAAIFDTISSAL